MKQSLPLLGTAQDAEARINILAETELNYQNTILTGDSISAEMLRQGSEIRASFEEFAESLGALTAGLDAAGGLIGGYQEAAGLGRQEPVYLANVRDRYRAIAVLARSSEIDSVVRSYSLVSGDLEARLQRREAELAEARGLLRGIARSSNGNEYTARYPQEAAVMFGDILNNIDRDLRTAAALLQRLTQEDPRIQSNPELQNVSRSIQGFASGFNGLLVQGRQDEARAAALAAQAESYRLEGDRLYQQAGAALNNNNFDLARERLERAGERYDASLAIQDSDSLRALRDQRLLSMDTDITGRETAIIGREVRQLITSAKTVYFNGDFERAEELLTTAQARWRRVFTEPDPELVYWLGLVLNAMALRSGRVIPVTAPLYSEMSQLLSDAHKSYDEGIRLLNQGRRPGALESLSRARQKTEEVKLVFPVNQEAGILQLRIDQVTDPDSFNTLFRDRFNGDMASIRQFRSAEAYADLQDLAAINPRYPGIRAALTEAEILLGLRPPPPDPADLARSRELARQAQALVDTSANSPSAMELALETLNQALELDPNNEQAIGLKNIVVPLTHGTAQNFLSSEAEQEYQVALQELQQGRYIIALDIVQRLLQDPRNKNNAKLLELRRRAESLAL
jgi:hypothetical protein